MDSKGLCAPVIRTSHTALYLGPRDTPSTLSCHSFLILIFDLDSLGNWDINLTFWLNFYSNLQYI